MRPSLEICKEYLYEGDLIGCEIGVQCGNNAISILENMPNLVKLHLIDSYSRSSEERIDELTKMLSSRYEKIEWHIKPSSDAVKDFDDDYFDFVYVDGGHRYQTVKDDLELYWPKIKTGGVFCGHDYSLSGKKFGNVQVDKAVNEFAYNNGLIIHLHHPDWWIFK